MSSGTGYPTSAASRPPTSDHHSIVAPTLASAPAKRTAGDAGASQAISGVRFVVDAASKADALQVLRNVSGECVVLGHNDSISVSSNTAITTVYLVFIGTAVSGAVVTSTATEAQFLSALVQLDFAAIDNVLRIDAKTLDILLSTGAVDFRYMEFYLEGTSYA